MLATVAKAGEPVEGVSVAFFVTRTFGRIKLAEEETLDDGTAVAPFPEGLPGNAKGEIEVVAEITAPEALAGTRAEVRLGGAPVPKPGRNSFPRALWSSRAPIPLVLTIVTLLFGVWMTYAYVIAQLLKIRKENPR